MNDALSYGGQAIAIAALWRLDRLTGPSAFYAIAVTSAVAAVLGAWQIRASLSLHVETDLMLENWSFGKWLLGASAGDWLSNLVYTYLSALMLGATAAAVLKAGAIVVGPINILLSYLDNVLPTRFARVWAAGGKLALRLHVERAYLFTAPIVGLYALAVALLAQPILRLLYGDTYLAYSTVVVLYAVLCFTNYLPRIVSAALQSRGLSKPVFVAYMCAGLITLGPSVVLINFLGVEGTVIGIICSTLTIFAVLWYQYQRRIADTTKTGQMSVDGVGIEPVAEPVALAGRASDGHS
jgi:O-antigen/teichoic acid export membrane protein